MLLASINNRLRVASVLFAACCMLCTVGSRFTHADDAVETMLDEHWSLLTMDDEPAGSTHSTRRQTIRDGMIVVANDEVTTINVERFGQQTQIVFSYHSEETVLGERLRFSLRIEVPGAETTQIAAEIQGDMLVCMTTEGDRTSETRSEWTAKLAAGMRFQSQFEDFAWQAGDTMTIQSYGLLDGVMTSTFVAKGETEVTMTDGSTRLLMQLDRTNELTDGTTQLVEYFLSPGEGTVIERRNGVVSERLSDEEAVSNLIGYTLSDSSSVEEMDGLLLEDFWEVAKAGDARLGHVHTTIHQIERDGDSMIVEESVGMLTTTRFGEDQMLMLHVITEEMVDGTLLRLTETYTTDGEPPRVLTAVVDGAELLITVHNGDELVQEMRIDWTADLIAGMQFASRFDKHDWQPGEEVTTTEYSFTNGVFSAKYINLGEAEVALFDGSTRMLLQIEKQDTLADGSVETTRFLIESGIGALLTQIVDADMTVERVPQEVATDVDLVVHETGTVIRVALPTGMSASTLHAASSATYQLTLPGIEAAMVLSDLRQTSVQLDADTIEVHVSSNMVSSSTCSEEDLAVCLASGPYIDLDDSLLQSLAEEGIQGAPLPLDQALALETFVGEMIVDDYSHLFDSASQVAVNKEGDCTEHSVLLVALLRLNGIPARSAAGLIIDGDLRVAMGHMWVEAYIDGCWMPLDAVRMGGNITPTYIKFANWDLLENDASAAEFLQAVSIWQSPLVIEVLGIEYAVGSRQ